MDADERVINEQLNLLENNEQIPTTRNKKPMKGVEGNNRPYGQKEP